MDTLEYRKLISALDEQIEKAKKEADLKQRKEQLEQHVKLILHQITSFETRKAEFDKYGFKAQGVDIEAVLKRLRTEKATLDSQIASMVEAPPPVVPDKEVRLATADHAEVSMLIDEIANINPGLMPELERWLLFEVWATRWRIIRERVGAAGDSGPMRFCYARIRESMDQYPTDQGWFIDGLDKTKGGVGYDWKARLEGTQRRLQEAVAVRMKEREQEENEIQWIQDLENIIKAYAANQDEVIYKDLCHAIRQAARLEHLREDIADMVAEFRGALGAEFAYLWQNGKPEEPKETEEAQHVTNREIVRRIMARLKNKGCIGASHAPMEKMYHGFPGHDQARAKVGLDLLIRHGVVRMKNTGIGQRVSLEPNMVARVDAFIQGKTINIKPVDEWCDPEVMF